MSVSPAQECYELCSPSMRLPSENPPNTITAPLLSQSEVEVHKDASTPQVPIDNAPSVATELLNESHESQNDAADLRLRLSNDTIDARSIRKEGATDSSTQRKGFNQSRRSIFHAWSPELAACALSLACLASIVGVLRAENGKPLDQWHLLVPANAVVSFIATLAKSSFLLALSEVISQLKWQHFERRPRPIWDFELFDAASRGPWGSCVLLLRQHRHALLGSSAAFIVLAALLVDPFVQLSIRFPSKDFPIETTAAAFSVSNTYDPNARNTTPRMYYDSRGTYLGMQAAVLEGFYDHPFESPVSCPTSNCTFRDVSSLGICSSCQNISAFINLVNCSIADQQIYTCLYTMPSGSILGAQISFDGIWSQYRQTLWNSSATTNFLLGGGGGYSWNYAINSSAIIASFYAIQLISNGTAFEDLGQPVTDGIAPASYLPRPTAWSCQFSYCAKTQSSITVINGTIDRGRVEEIPLLWSGNSLDNGRPKIGNGTQQQELVSMHSLWELRPSPGHARESITSYWVNRVDGNALGLYLQCLFSTGYMNTTTSSQYSDVYENSACMAPDMGEQLSKTRDIPQLISNISSSMSEVMRVTNGTAHPGQSYVWKSYIDVRWAWLALPITLAFLSTVLLLLTMWNTERSRTPMWKSSALAALYYRGDGWQDTASHMASRAQLDKEAKKTSIQLSKTEGHVFMECH